MSYSYLQKKPEIRKQKPVTLIVGIICKDGIVMASDSQTTSPTMKSLDTVKMSEFRHQSDRALIAGAGAVLSSAKAIEHFMRLAPSAGIDGTSLPEVASVAIKKTRDEFRHQQFDCSSEEFQDFLKREELGCELMLAHYEGGLTIDTVKLSMGIPYKCKSFWEAIGTGADVGSYLLKDLCTPDMECKIASVIAVHIIEAVKSHDPFCGGAVQLGILKSPVPETLPIPTVLGGHSFDPSRYYSPPLILPRKETDEIVQMVSEVEAATKKKRSDIIKEALEKQSGKRMEEMWEDLFPKWLYEGGSSLAPS